MASGIVKFRLVAGSREIEVEGTSGEVNALLEKWWRGATDEPAHESADENTEKSGGKTKRKAKKTAGKSTSSRQAKQDDPNAFDAHAFANDVKEDERFDTFQKKIFNVRGDWYNKTAFVIWYAERALSSGAVIRALNALDVRGDTPQVSNAIARNMTNFLSDKQRQAGVTPEYRLTGAAKTAFEKWLLKKPDGDG